MKLASLIRPSSIGGLLGLLALGLAVPAEASSGIHLGHSVPNLVVEISPDAVPVSVSELLVDGHLDTNHPLLRRDQSPPVARLMSQLFYYANTTIGDPPASFELILDTTQADILVLQNNIPSCPGLGAAQNCALGATFESSDAFMTIVSSDPSFNITYLDGEFMAGLYGTDAVVLGDIVLNNTVIGVVNETSYAAQGLLGLGWNPPDSVTDAPILSQVLTNMIGLEYIESPVFSLYMPWDGTRGHLLFGAVDTAKFNGSLFIMPIMPSIAPGQSKAYYQYPVVSLTSISVSSESLSTPVLTDANIPVLLDSSSVISYLPFDVVVDIVIQINAVYLPDNGIWVQSCSYRGIDGNVNFSFSGATISVPISNLLVPLINSATGDPYMLQMQPMCALTFGDSAVSGYTSVGANILSEMYLVIDYEDLLVGIGRPANVSSSSTSASTTTKSTTTGTVSTTSSTSTTTTLAHGGVVTAGLQKARVAKREPKAAGNGKDDATTTASLAATITAKSVSTNPIEAVSVNLTDVKGATLVTSVSTVVLTISDRSGNFSDFGDRLPLMIHATNSPASNSNFDLPSSIETGKPPPLPLVTGHGNLTATATSDTFVAGANAYTTSSITSILVFILSLLIV